MLNRLKTNFYHQNTLKLASNLLGKYIVRKYNKTRLIAKIVETEAYYGPDDKASHASKGKTPRTALMFDKAGTAYIYLVYGMYNCFNIVSENKDFPAAIFIRSVEPIEGIKQMQKNRTQNFKSHTSDFKLSAFGGQTSLTNGPGKFCQAFKIDKKLNGENLITSSKIYLANNPKEEIKTSQIKKAKRIGIDYAGSYKNKLWRFYLKDSPFISKK